MDLSVVMVSYDACELTRSCLASVFAQTTDLSVEVIVVDNASSEPTVEMMRRDFPQVRLIPLDENIGFARAVNLGAAQARGDHIVLLNPDTVVLDAALERLLRFARANPGHGLYGGRTLAADGSVDPSSCWGMPTMWSYFCFATGLTTVFRQNRWLDPESLGRWPRDSVREVGVVTGCLCLISRDDWRRLGGFDERYFMYGEDVDLAMRARQLGMRPIITPAATIVHFVGGSSAARGDKRILVMQGKMTLIRQHRTSVRLAVAQRLVLLGVAVRSLHDSSWRETWRERERWRSGYSGIPPSTSSRDEGQALLPGVGG